MNRSFAFLVFATALCCTSLSEAADVPFLVQETMISDTKAVIATVESVHEMQARARIGGTITSLLVKEGDAVKADDKIAVIGDAKLAIRGQGYQARIQGAQSSFEKAKQDFARAQELRNTGYGTQAKLDEARNNLTVAENALRAAEADKQELSQQTAEGVVVAPSAGRILKVPVAVGSVVMAGDTVATMSQEDYVLRLELPERHARFLKPGDSVKIGVRGLLGDDTQESKIGYIRLVYPAIQNGRVIADVTVSDLGNYFVGERTRVYITAGQRAAFVVPKELVYKRAGTSFVRLKSGAEVVVQTGQSASDTIEILTGLRSGDEVIKP